ncbi:MAG: efflux RND transporter periplasmic adaptor subunit [Bacteroidota bacterium]|nr:efflux RND transporter periplasmic adaptor subunit [Bacteroidota bacterium]
MIKQFLKATVFYLTLLLPSILMAHGGEDHEHDAGKKSSFAPKTYFTSVANSELYEVLLKYKHMESGEESEMQLFISDYHTNAPISKATITITSPGNANLVFKAEPTGESGIYRILTSFPEKKSYDLQVKINSSLGPDLMVLKNIETEKELPKDEEEKEKDAGINPYLMLGLGILGGIIIMVIINKAFRKKSAASLMIILLILGPQPIPNSLHAHEDHNAASTKEVSLSNDLLVPKETQFLFEVLTKEIANGDFTESTKLLGTVVPASNGQAIITVPTNGKIISLSSSVGKMVKKGEQLGVIEMNLDASSQVSYLTEKNNIEAEYNAAKSDYESLNKIADIASKKELSEAKSRFESASQNKKLFDSGSGKTIILRSPIDGVLGNYTYTTGSTVNANETIFTVTDLSKVYVEAQVFDKDADKIKNSVKYSVECTNDNHKTANVRLLSMAQSINQSNQSQRVLFEMENPEGEFKIGEFVNVRVFAEKDQRKIYVPNSSISEINGKPVVFIKEGPEDYSISYVSTGENNGSFTVINKGIEQNERVVVNGSYQLKMMYLNQ